jgi:septum formation protein
VTAEPRIVLASGSPRRRQLLALIGLAHRVQPADVEELQRPGEEPSTFAIRAACDKALAVASEETELPILAADTVVELAGDVLGKPTSTDDAVSMLRRLSSRTHRVHTGMAIVHRGAVEALVDTAVVRFQHLTDDVIRWYVATGEPMDKAGAYAVQGAGGLLVAGIDGSPQTVVGLPIHRLPELYGAHGLDFWESLEG